MNKRNMKSATWSATSRNEWSLCLSTSTVNGYLEHAVISVDKWFVDAEVSIAHQLLGVQTVATHKSTIQAGDPDIHHSGLLQQ